MKAKNNKGEWIKASLAETITSPPFNITPPKITINAVARNTDTIVNRLSHR